MVRTGIFSSCAMSSIRIHSSIGDLPAFQYHSASEVAATLSPTSESLWQECGSNTPKQIEVGVTTRS